MSAQQNTAKPKRKREKWGTSKRPLNTPPSKQALVVGLSFIGKKRSAISRELGLDRETVTRILSQQENQLLVQGYRAAVLKIVPDALIGLSELVKRLDRQAIIETLYGSRVLVHRQEVEKAEEPRRNYTYPKVEFFAKYGRWPLLEEAIEFEKTLEIEPLTKGELQRSPTEPGNGASGAARPRASLAKKYGNKTTLRRLPLKSGPSSKLKPRQ